MAGNVGQRLLHYTVEVDGHIIWQLAYLRVGGDLQIDRHAVVGRPFLH